MTRNKLRVLASLPLPRPLFKLKLCCILEGAWGHVSSSTYCYPAADVIEAQRSAARIVVSFRRAEKRLFLALADRLLCAWVQPKKKNSWKWSWKLFVFFSCSRFGCAFRPACSIWQKNKRKATRATKTTVASSWNPPMLPPFPHLLYPLPLAAAHCRWTAALNLSVAITPTIDATFAQNCCIYTAQSCA